MNIPESLVWLAGSLSGINIYCQDNQKEEIQSFLEKSFAEEWSNAIYKVEEEYGDADFDGEEIGNPMHIECNNEGLFARFDSLCIPFSHGDYSDDEYGNDALTYTLKKLEKKYSDVQYEGYIAYSWSDVHAGNVTQYSVHSKSQAGKETYGFIAEELKRLDYEELPEETDDPDDLKEILCFVAAHKEWIDVEEIYNRILSVANDIDGEMCEELNGVVARLRDGEKVIARDNFNDYKIDDEYDAAMRAFIAAEEYEKELIHDGFMPELTVANYKGETSNEIDYYPHVAVKATEGDERALEIAQMLENI